MEWYEWLPIIISVSSLGIAVFAFYRARPIEKQQYDSNSMLECFKLLSNEDVKKSKKALADKRTELLKENKPIHFDETLKSDVWRVQEAYNQVSVLYLLNLLNKENFRKVYGKTVVTTWKIIRDDVIHTRASITGNAPICLQLEEVANDFIVNHCIDDEPYTMTTYHN